MRVKFKAIDCNHNDVNCNEVENTDKEGLWVVDELSVVYGGLRSSPFVASRTTNALVGRWVSCSLLKCSRTSIMRPPSIKRPFSAKVPKFLWLNCCIRNFYSTATSIKQATFLLLQGYYLSLWFFTSIKQPANFLFNWNGDKSLEEAMHITDQPTEFAEFHGYQDLTIFFWKANDFFLPLQLRAWQQQTEVNAQIEGIWCFATMILAFYIFTSVRLHMHTFQPQCC